MISAFAAGALIGAVGIGGILLIPALAAFGGLGVREAMATALFTFIFTGIIGTVLYQRKRSIDWLVTVPVCAGALVFAFAGAWLNALTRPQMLTLALSAVIIFAGIYTLKPSHGRSGAAFAHSWPAQRVLLVAIGAVAGLGAGWAGVGGPVLSVPLMVLFGFPALASIAASQALQILAATSGSIGNLAFGSIDFALALPVTGAEIAGVFVGSAIAHAVDQRVLRTLIGLLCVPVGAFLGAQALINPAHALLPQRPPEVNACLRFQASTSELSAESQAVLTSYLKLSRPAAGQGNTPEYEVLRVSYPQSNERETLLANLKLASERQAVLTKTLFPGAPVTKFLTQIQWQAPGEKCDATIRSTYSFKNPPEACVAAKATECRIECTSTVCSVR